ncbi:MAG TPA: glycosyltransferase 87 family protein [Terriglobia bacterium]|nr:glycosyltransferase 87 family protein [Terriglobia bacterium]
MLLVLLAALFLWRGLLPGWRSLNTDFPNYYLAARLYRQGYSLNRVYDWIWFQRQKDHAGIEPRIVEFIPSTPYAGLVVLPFAGLPPLQAKQRWLALNLLLLVLTGCLLSRMTTLGPRRVALLVFLAVIPLRNNFLYGQEHVALLFLLTLAAWLYLEGRTASSGIALALAAALRIYPGLFVFYFLRKKQWRATLALLLACAGLGLVAVWLFGFPTVRNYVVEVLPRAFKGEDINPYDVHWDSFTALARRLFVAEPEMNPHPLAHLPAAYAVLQPLIEALLFVPFLWLMRSARSEPAREKLEFGGYVALLLVMSTHPAAYHFCVLILAIALATDSLLRFEHRKQALLVVALYTLVCLPLQRFTPGSPSGWHAILAFPKFYAMTALWLMLLWELVKTAPRRRWRSYEAAVFAGLFVALTLAGAWTNLRHLRGQFANYASRVVTTPDALMAAEPAAAAGTLAFTTMSSTWNGYVTAGVFPHFTQGPLEVLDFGADTFHPALDSTAADEWVEIASTRSRIVRFPSRDSSLVAPATALEVDNAEQPTVSPDGQWLAFIRETQGRGSLWVKSIGAGAEAAPSATNPAPRQSEQKLVDSTSDVLEAAFFPDHRLAFAAQPDGQPALFVVDIKTQLVRLLSPPGVRARYPAISPDGEWLASAREEKGNWQLQVVKFSRAGEIATGDEHRLTNADCNSISPAWLQDSKTLVYATDCGRGLGLTALAKIRAVP